MVKLVQLLFQRDVEAELELGEIFFHLTFQRAHLVAETLANGGFNVDGVVLLFDSWLAFEHDDDFKVLYLIVWMVCAISCSFPSTTSLSLHRIIYFSWLRRLMRFFHEIFFSISSSSEFSIWSIWTEMVRFEVPLWRTMHLSILQCVQSVQKVV